MPAPRHIISTSRAARSPAPVGSLSTITLKHSMPDRTGNFAMIAVEPVAQMGLRPIDIAASAVSRPSAICRHSSTSASSDSLTIPAGEPSVFAVPILRPAGSR